MATQTVDYLSCTRICCGTLPSAVIICLPSAIVAPHVCTITEEDDTYPRAYVLAEISAERCISTGCKTNYIYSISVDDTQLIDDTTLSGSEITGIFCRSCFTDWVEDAIGDESYIDTDEGGAQSFVSPHGCIYPLTVGPSPTFQDYAVDLTQTGTMSYSATTVGHARYMLLGKTCFVQIAVTGTTGGVAAANIEFSLPFPPRALVTPGFPAFVYALIDDGGTTEAGNIRINDTNGTACKSDITQLWTLGAGRNFTANFFYEIA